jgi:hypothetical protein
VCMAEVETTILIGTKEGTRTGTLTTIRTGGGPLSPVLLVDGERYEPVDVPRGWRLYATPETDRQLAYKAVGVGYPIEGLAPAEPETPVYYLVRKVRRLPNGTRFVTIPNEYAEALELDAGDVVRVSVDGPELRMRKQDT